MLRRVWTLIGILGLGLAFVAVARGQAPETAPDTTEPWFHEAWTKVIEQDGVRIDYIYYPEADNTHDGLVLRLINNNDVAVWYAFTIIFRSPAADTSMSVQGRIAAGQMKTGDKAGLFWIPFKGQDQRLGEVGLRGLKIWSERDPGSPQSDSTLGGKG